MSKITILILLVYLSLTSCADLKTTTNDLIFIQKGKSFDYYLKQKDYYYSQNVNEYNINPIKNFDFEFNGNVFRCNMLPVINKIVQSTRVREETTINDRNSFTGSRNFSDTKTTTKTITDEETDNYYVITDKNNIVIDFFYMYEVKNGTKKTDTKILDAMNKAYLNYLIACKVYDNEDIKDMDDNEKLMKLKLR